MIQPPRLREVGSDDVRQLLLQGRPTALMTAHERARTAARAQGQAAPTSSTLLVGSKGLVLALAVGLGVAAVGVAGPAIQVRPRAHPSQEQVATPHDRSRTPPADRQPAVDATAASVALAPIATASAEGPQPAEAKPRARAKAPTASRTSESEEDVLAREALLLERARAALSSSPARALQLTEEHARSFPQGKLSLERELVAIDALQRRGQTSAARARAHAVLRQGAGGIYEVRIRRLLDKSL